MGMLEDVGEANTDEPVDVPTGALSPTQVEEHRQALPLLEEWAGAEHVATWFGALAQHHQPAELFREKVAQALRAAGFLGCDDFLSHAAKLCLFYLRAVGAAGFLELGDAAWPDAATQFSAQVLQQLDEVHVDAEQLPVDQMAVDHYIGPDLFDGAIGTLAEHHDLFSLNDTSIRAALLWLGFVPALRARDVASLHFSNADTPYITVPLSQELLARYIVTHVNVVASAHDQGWSSYRADQGSRNNSWTFADLAVCSLAEAGTPHPLFREERVYTNIHASGVWQEHVVELAAPNPLLEFVNSHPTEGGLLLELRARAMFPGWVHYMQRAEMIVTLAPRH